MTIFTRMPIKEVFINDLVQEDMEDFLYTCRVTNVSSAIWVDGIIMIFHGPMPSDKNSERYFEGYRMYEKVSFVKHTKYSKTVKWNGGTYELALKNYKNNPRFVELAEWIKTQPVWDEPRESKN